mgnify:CR=1 FL=1
MPEVVNQEQIAKDTKIMNFAVSNDNKYYFDGEEVNIDNLESFISERMKDFPDGLLIQVDDDAEHGAVVKLMDCARNIGITSISLAH